MKELIEYRKNLIERLVAAANEFRTECLSAKNVFTPLEPGGWTIHQLAAHTRDVDKLVYGSRVRRTATEYNPEFQNFDGEVYMAQHYTSSELLEEIVDELVMQVESMAAFLKELPAEAWARLSSHVMLGRGITLQSWVEKALAHIEEHLATLHKHRL